MDGHWEYIYSSKIHNIENGFITVDKETDRSGYRTRYPQHGSPMRSPHDKRVDVRILMQTSYILCFITILRSIFSFNLRELSNTFLFIDQWAVCFLWYITFSPSNILLYLFYYLNSFAFFRLCQYYSCNRT